MTRTIKAAAWLAALALAVGCGSESAQEKLEEANERIRAIQNEVAEAQSDLDREEEELAEAEAEVDEAREALREAKARLAAARGQVAEVADDAYLFRAVQSALLNDPALEDLAIGARVRDRVVTLEGQVPSQALRERAEAVAVGILGVESVDNKVSVAPAAR